MNATEMVREKILYIEREIDREKKDRERSRSEGDRDKGRVKRGMREE